MTHSSRCIPSARRGSGPGISRRITCFAGRRSPPRRCRGVPATAGGAARLTRRDMQQT